MIKKYPSKVSYGLLFFIFLVFYGPLLPNLFKGELNGKIIVLIGFLSLIFAFVLNLFLKTQYTIDDKKLKIDCGPLSFQPIDISEIKEVSTTKSMLSSPAPSFDRIEIKYGKSNMIIISPKNKFRFVEDLIKINPSIKNNLKK